MDFDTNIRLVGSFTFSLAYIYFVIVATLAIIKEGKVEEIEELKKFHIWIKLFIILAIANFIIWMNIIIPPSVYDASTFIEFVTGISILLVAIHYIFVVWLKVVK